MNISIANNLIKYYTVSARKKQTKHVDKTGRLAVLAGLSLNMNCFSSETLLDLICILFQHWRQMRLAILRRHKQGRLYETYWQSVESQWNFIYYFAISVKNICLQIQLDFNFERIFANYFLKKLNKFTLLAMGKNGRWQYVFAMQYFRG